MIYITIDETNNNKRIDIALSNLCEHSRSAIQKLIHASKIKHADVTIVKPNTVVKEGDVYAIEPPESNLNYIKPEKGDLEILFEDNDIIVLNKPHELIIHPGAGNYNGTLINRLAYYCTLSDVNGAERIGVIHRLDKGVSGCIIFAKNNATHIKIAQQFQDRTIQKTYIALCYGKLPQKSGMMEDYMARSEYNRKKMACKDSGKHALMEYSVENMRYLDAHHGFISKIRCFPKTGRMHQIRVQLASRKVPIIGDSVYGRKQNAQLIEILGARIALHAYSIEFIHPQTNETMKIVAQEPDAFSKIISSL